jgi:hypothetical protein
MGFFMQKYSLAEIFLQKYFLQKKHIWVKKIDFPKDFTFCEKSHFSQPVCIFQGPPPAIGTSILFDRSIDRSKKIDVPIDRSESGAPPASPPSWNPNHVRVAATSSLGLRASVHLGPISNILDSSAASVSRLEPPPSA